MSTAETLYALYRKHGKVSTDSRRIPPGCLFFALRGERFDGNRYAAGALEAGAGVAVVDDPAVLPEPSDAAYSRYVLVENTLTALQELAALHRLRLGIPILAITGSNGKTTTKELVWRVLSKAWPTAVTHGNLNNHIGVPLTLLEMGLETRFGVVEMGANHPGEIAALCRIARPDFGLITNIGEAHLEGFGGPEGVRRGKGELFDFLAETGGKAFFRQEDPVLQEMAAERSGLKILPYSTAALNGENRPGGLHLTWKGISVQTHLTGGYNLANLGAAIAVGDHFGVPRQEIAEALASYTPDNNRSQCRQTEYNTLILDAYNANPSSMRAALENFSREALPADLPGIRSKAVILGDMLELGAYSGEAHRGILALLRSGGIDEALLVGPLFTQALQAENVPSGFRSFPDTAALNRHLEAHPLCGRLILLKGSRGIRLEEAVHYL